MKASQPNDVFSQGANSSQGLMLYETARPPIDDGRRLAFTHVAFAQDKKPTSAPVSSPASTQTSTTRTSDYVEQNLSGDQVIKFTGDELAGGNGSPSGSMIVRVIGPARAPLIRPRLNFVAELLKSVENL